MRIRRRRYAVLALLAHRKNGFGKSSANVEMGGALSGGRDGIGTDNVFDIALLGIGGSRCLAIRSRGGKCNFGRGQTDCSDTCHPDHRKFHNIFVGTYIKCGTTKPETRNSSELSWQAAVRNEGRILQCPLSRTKLGVEVAYKAERRAVVG